MKFFRNAMLIAVLMLGSSGAHAIMATFEIDGIVTDAEAGNPFGLAVGNLITATATFQYDVYGGFQAISFGQGSGNELNFQVGLLAFDETMDIDFEFGYFPLLFLFDGAFDGFDYLATEGLNGAPASFSAGLGFDGLGFGFPVCELIDGELVCGEEPLLEVNGEWLAQNARLTVPEPGSLALLGLGIAGLGFARRRKGL